MILERLVLRNFKRFRTAEILFRDGITGILGNNGTGKSSIVTAIFFALYGVQATGIRPDYIVSSFASLRDRCEVRLDFSIGGGRFSVTRQFRKGRAVSHDASLYRDGRLVATGVSQVDDAIRRTLGMGAVDFRNTIYAAQNDLLILLESTPGRRKDWFLKALGIDFLKTESDANLKEQVEEKSRELLSLEGSLGALSRDVHPEEYAALQGSVGGLSDSLASLAGEHRAIAARKKAVDEEHRAFIVRKTEFARLCERRAAGEREVRALASQKNEAEAKAEGLETIAAELNQLEGQVRGIPEKRKEIEVIRGRKAAAEKLKTEERFVVRKITELGMAGEKIRARLRGLEQDTARLQILTGGIAQTLTLDPGISLPALEEAIAARTESIRNETAHRAARLDHLMGEQDRIRADFTAIQAAGPDGTCPLCRQTLGPHYPGIEQEFEAGIRALDEEAADVRRAMERLKEETNRLASVQPPLTEARILEARVRQRPDAEGELEEIRKEISAQERERRALKEKISEISVDEAALAAAEGEYAGLERSERRYHDLRAAFAGIPHLRELVSSLDRRIAEMTVTLDAIRSELTVSAFDEKRGGSLEQERAEADTALRVNEAESVRMTERLRYIREEIARYRKTEAAIVTLKSKVEALQGEMALLRLTRGIIADFVIYLLQVVRTRIEGETSRILAGITAGRYEQVLLDENFNLLVRDIDGDYPAERFSGGEQDDIAVAMRIALSRYLSEVHNVHESTVLIFDEIFGSQDEERRNSLIAALRTQESRFPQILLISHIAEIQGEFSTTLLVETTADGTSQVREVPG